MADRIQTFTTRIFLNDEQAKSKITELGKRITTVRADMDKAYKKKKWEDFNTLKKELDQRTKELNSMRTTAQSVEHVLKNLSSSSVKEIKRTISAINKELTSGSVARNTDDWKFLTEQLERAKKELKKIGDINKGITKSEGWSWLKKLNDVGLDDTDACCFGRLLHLSASKRQVSSDVQPAKHCFPNFCDNCHGISRRLPRNITTVGTEYRDSCHRLQRAGNWGDGNQ